MKKAAVGIIAALSLGISYAGATVYGTFDEGIRLDRSANANSERNVRMLGGVLSPPKLGFKADEDVGSGKKIGIKLEIGFNPATGSNAQTATAAPTTTTPGSVLFDSAAYVSISDRSIGEFQFGRNTNAGRDISLTGVFDPTILALDGAGAPVNVSNSTYSVKPLRVNQAIGFVASTNGYRSTRSDSMIKYINNFGPTQVVATFAPGGEASSGNKSSQSLGVVYNKNNLMIGGAAFQTSDAAGKKYVSQATGVSYTVGKATYTIGRFKQQTEAGYVAANLTTASAYSGPVLGTALTSGPSTESKLNVYGVKYKFNDKVTTTVAYNDGIYENGVGSVGKLKTYMLINEYGMSKRTTLFGIVDSSKAGRDFLSASTSATNVAYTVGIRHTF